MFFVYINTHKQQKGGGKNRPMLGTGYKRFLPAKLCASASPPGPAGREPQLSLRELPVELPEAIAHQPRRRARGGSLPRGALEAFKKGKKGNPTKTRKERGENGKGETKREENSKLKNGKNTNENGKEEN